MAITSPTTPPADGAALPTPPSSSSPSNFDTLADAFLSAFPGFQTSMNATKANAYANAMAAYNNALQSQSDASAAAANAAIASAAAGATLWVSGTTYVIGDVRWSPGNGRIYRRITNGGGTTDPYNDPTNWTPIGLNAPAQVVNALVHQAISGQCLALANTTAQPSATNSLLYSDNFSNGAWVKGSTIISTSVSTGPNGEGTVEQVLESATTAAHFMYQAITAPANVARTWSVYAKGAGRSTFVVEMDRDGNGIDMVVATFNLSTGTVSAGTNTGTASGAASSIVHVGDGWYFCTLSGTCSTSAGTSVRALVYINTSASYTGDGVSGIKFAGMQLEAGSSASSRIPTTSATVTRSAGVVAPQRIVLPASPGADAWVKPVVANGVATNVIDPNGGQFKGANGIVSGPIELDNIGFSGALQFIDGYWRFV